MEYPVGELVAAQRVIDSLISKCEKVILKLKEGSSQYSLTRNRITALRIASSMIEGRIMENHENATKKDTALQGDELSNTAQLTYGPIISERPGEN
ncbi:MAG: hypothetical protein LBU61_00645 [Coriobacteriales bacterium]|nr:hypothetical protein [Coriobacteriales bacterium]